MKSHHEWDAWIKKFKATLTSYQIRSLDESVEFNLCVKDGDFAQAERLAFQITQGKSPRDRKRIQTLGEIENI